MSNEGDHESGELLSDETKNLHRAIVSLEEELQAVDWYQQRAEACSDDELREILVHNKNEELEHASMLLEWLRQHSPVLAANIGTYLNSNGPITAAERQHVATIALPTNSSASPSLGIGSLKERA